MTSQPRSRASQSDPDDSPFAFQQQRQPAQNTSQRSSQDLSYSSSGDSTAATFINLAGQNNSSTSVPISSSPLPSSQNSQILSSLSSLSPLGSHHPSNSPIHSSSSSNGSAPLFSKSSASAPKPTRPIQPSSNNSANTTQTLQRLNLEHGGNHHAKSDSVASVRSKLVDRGSTSSPQLNLRTNQQRQYPTRITSPSLSSGEGVWNESQLMAPSPIYPKRMDPAFMKEQQQQEGQTQSRRRGAGSENGNNEDHTARNSMMSLTTNRQDEGRLQLEQEREYQKTRKLKTWNRSKALLLFANTLLLLYSAACTVVMVMSWKGAAWTKPYLDSGIMLVANRKVFYIMMAAAPFGVFVALIGYIGILSQSRKVLSIYSILLWPLFALITTVGYLCYRRNHLALYQKLKFSWINEYSRDDRLIIQNTLSCCGYRSLGDYPSYDLYCFPRAPLPSCESAFLKYQQDLLSNTSSAAFLILPVQLLIMIVALLCSNHIDNLYRTAYPITPKLYTQ